MCSGSPHVPVDAAVPQMEAHVVPRVDGCPGVSLFFSAGKLMASSGTPDEHGDSTWNMAIGGIQKESF